MPQCQKLYKNQIIQRNLDTKTLFENISKIFKRETKSIAINSLKSLNSYGMHNTCIVKNKIT
jgi:hypothetical protein